MKPRLLILSDMWGLDHCDWITYYQELLDPAFSIRLLDSCDLGDVDATDGGEAAIHAAFTHGGIATAAQRLLDMEKEKVDILAFSIGGTIAWEAGMKGLAIGRLHAVSATRLRLQRKKPGFPVHLYYGSDDPFQPTADWFVKMGIAPAFIERGAHDFHTRPASARRIHATIMADRGVQDP